MNGKKWTVALLAWLVLCSTAAFSQNVSAVLSGTVKDPAGAIIAGAEVTLTNQGTNAVDRSTTNEAGIFVFPTVLPGSYSLQVAVTGFSSFHMKNIAVATNERRTVGDITLRVGDIQQTVEVTSQSTPVQTTSSERAGLISGDQILNTAVKGRDFIGLLSILPGVIDTNVGSREVTMTGNVLNGLHINGGRTNSIMYALDGISSVDTGSNSSVQNQPNMDAISEVSVLSSNFQAEYGRNSSGTINVVTKSGTQNFHGSAYWYYRDKGLNANTFFNNRNGAVRGAYHFNNVGYSVGGPVYIPGKFNTSKDKLFFFFSQEFVRRILYQDPRYVTTPTQLERNGDFSKTFDVSGALIQIKDPTTGQQFPGNIIPSTRINKLGQQILNFFPLPNYVETDPSLQNRRNYKSTAYGKNPRRQEVVRIDYNVTPTLRAYFRGIRDNDDEEWPYGSWVSGNVNYDLVNTLRPQRGRGAVLNVTKIINPTTVNEFTFGATTRGQTFNPVDPSKVARSRMGNIGQWYPSSNESHAIPDMTFGGVQNAITPSLGNIPYTNENPVFAWTDNFNKLIKTHSLKFGIYIERMRKDEVGGPNTRGSFAFGRDTNNPLDSNYAFSNAILGNFQSYSEGTFRPYSHYRYTQVEWYAQDSWKVSKKLTLDYGLRLYNGPGAHDERYALTNFDPSKYNKSKAARLIYPGTSGGKRVGIDRVTGTVYPVPYIGLFVPGSGDYASGMLVAGKGEMPGSLYETPAVSWGPRLGFALDPQGNGKMAIRGGIGVFYDRPQGNVYSATNGQPPVAYTPTLYYGNLDTFLQSQGAIGPSGVTTIQVGKQSLPRIVNYSLGVQRDIGFSTVVDVSYVGTVGRHLLYVKEMNPILMYARFDPANKDTTTTSSPLADIFLRPYLGLGSINQRSFGATSSYNSLQLTVNRRMHRGLQLSASYTFSKSLGIAGADFDSISPYFPARTRNYGLPDWDRSQQAVINFTYQVPNLGQTLNSKPLDAIVGGWQVSGIVSFVSGAPFTPGFSTVDGADITGSAEGARIDMIADPSLPKSERTFARNFKTEAFARPASRTFGNIGIRPMRGPGINNWDLSVSKRFPLYSEQRYIQFRAEFFNAFNHTQFSGMDTTARFDATGKQTNANFGAFTGAREPRRIQMSLRLMF